MLTDNAIKVLEKRYFLKDNEGKTENWEALCRRVSSFLTEDNEKFNEYLNTMLHLDFLPNSPTLMNAGTEFPMLSACFVLSLIQDSMKSIMKAASDHALISKLGGGTGMSFSHLRPKGDKVGSVGSSSGPVSFMEIFNTISEVVVQGGRRRAASMAVLRVDHPDILEFITVKQDLKKLNNFNLSVGITDEFMEAAIHDETFNLINPKDNTVFSIVQAKDVMDTIVRCAWATGEPGLLFLDEINRKDPTPEIGGPIEASNPCGEATLKNGGACNLGSINLTRHIKDGNFDWKKLEQTIRIACNFLNDVIDKALFPLPEIDELVKKLRNIGLGVMGWADALILMKIKYDSDAALAKAEELMKFISRAAKKYAPNNTQRTSIAPTGTLSIFANCSSGIEPNYSHILHKNVMGGETLISTHPLYESHRDYFRTAHQIPLDWHVKMQAAFQKYVEMGVSKTANAPKSATLRDVEKAFVIAYKLKCKGITVYRDGSRDGQVLNDPSKKKYITPRPRPEVTTGITKKVRIGCGDMYLTLNSEEDNGVIELLIPSSRGCQSQSEALARIISVALRSGVDPRIICKHLSSVKCSSCITKKDQGVKYLSCPDAIGRTIRELTEEKVDQEDKHRVTCAECGHRFKPEGGCYTCPECGVSKCGG